MTFTHFLCHRKAPQGENECLFIIIILLIIFLKFSLNVKEHCSDICCIVEQFILGLTRD